MNRLLAISDIHGHLEALQTLLHYAKYVPNEDELYFVGDYINKGPQSRETLDAVKEYVKHGAHAVMGNHERKALYDLQTGGRTWEDAKDFLYSLPLFLERPPYIFVHAGIRTGVPLSRQLEEDLLTIRGPFFKHELIENATVVFGHTPTHRLRAPVGTLWKQRKKLGIDTGAGQNYYLSLVDLTNQIQYRIPVLKPYFHQIQIFEY